MRKADTLTQAIHINNMIGGDNCSRSMMIGAAFAASENEIPSQWIEKISSKLWDEIEIHANQVNYSLLLFYSYSIIFLII